MSHIKPTGEAFLSNVLELMLDAVCVVDSESRFVFVSAACERIFGYRPDEMVGRPMLDFVHPDDRQRTLQAVDEIVVVGPKPHFENRYVRKDGAVVHVMWSARWSESDQVRVAVARDVTKQRRAEFLQSSLHAIAEAAYAVGTLQALLARAHEVLESAMLVSSFGVTLGGEGQAYPNAEELDTTALAELVLATRQMTRQEREGHEWIGLPLDLTDGSGALVIRGHTTRCSDDDIELLHDVAARLAVVIERHRAATNLQRAARHDPLTDLPNRLLLGERMQTALVRALQDRSTLAVLYLDLDLFKQVNDDMGHAVGDLLLQETARRLKACVRDSDTVARIGGDEFVVLLCHLRVSELALTVAEKIRVSLSRPYELAGHVVRVSPSIGIANYPEHGADEATLIQHADAAMYQAKRSGGNRFWTSTSALARDDR